VIYEMRTYLIAKLVLKDLKQTVV